jgi:nitroreductase
MEFEQVVRRRRMVRSYTQEGVDREVVDRILDWARRAPSAGFTQGCYFIAVDDASTRRRIAELADEPDYVSRGFDPWLSSAPVHVVVCVSEADYHDRYRQPDKLTEDGTEIEWPVPYWYVDAGGALLLILLGAVEEGLAAGFFGVHRLPELRGLLGIPEDVTPIGVVTMGTPAPERRSGSSKRGRKPLEEVVHWGRWAERAPSSLVVDEKSPRRI